MNDTSDAIAKVVLAHYRSMTPSERCLVASSLYQTAREIIESSLPSDLTIEERRLTAIERLYKGELPEEALLAHANYIANGARDYRVASPPKNGAIRSFDARGAYHSEALHLFPGACKSGGFARSRHGRLHGGPGNK
jgi:hypothetical protein